MLGDDERCDAARRDIVTPRGDVITEELEEGETLDPAGRTRS
jgi:hypothetical protein